MKHIWKYLIPVLFIGLIVLLVLPFTDRSGERFTATGVITAKDTGIEAAGFLGLGHRTYHRIYFTFTDPKTNGLKTISYETTASYYDTVVTGTPYTTEIKIVVGQPVDIAHASSSYTALGETFPAFIAVIAVAMVFFSFNSLAGEKKKAPNK